MKILCLLLICLLLGGCSGGENFENLQDVYQPQLQNGPQQILCQLPEGAAAQTVRSDYGQLYFCDGYEIAVCTLAGGSIGDTLRELTGYAMEELTVVKTGTTGALRYECVWTSAGEGGDAVGRAAVIDDGSYHYCLTVMAAETDAPQLRDTWQELFASFTLSSPGSADKADGTDL